MPSLFSSVSCTYVSTLFYLNKGDYKLRGSYWLAELFLLFIYITCSYGMFISSPSKSFLVATTITREASTDTLFLPFLVYGYDPKSHLLPTSFEATANDMVSSNNEVFTAYPLSDPASTESAVPDIRPHHHIEHHKKHNDILGDAIIGFADGLTVPFALTAGLSA